MFYFANCINIIFNSLLAQLVKYDVHTTRKIKFIHAIIYHILLCYYVTVRYVTLRIDTYGSTVRYGFLRYVTLRECGKRALVISGLRNDRYEMHDEMRTERNGSNTKDAVETVGRKQSQERAVESP